ncbi:hypothetical protein HanPSC8_Chr16g0736901 [Helianthus annuus]|nr:hypothetical protein HanPSC8_Chr16g0736901 [Helianthus annuus]
MLVSDLCIKRPGKSYHHLSFVTYTCSGKYILTYFPYTGLGYGI